MSYFTAEIGEYARITEAHLIAARFNRENERMAQMDRLTEKLNRAAGVVGRVTAKLEERADFVIAREDAIDKRGERLFSAKHAILDDADKGLDGIEAKLALLSNDPLDGSGRSPEVGQTATFPAKL